MHARKLPRVRQYLCFRMDQDVCKAQTAPTALVAGSSACCSMRVHVAALCSTTSTGHLSQLLWPANGRTVLRSRRGASMGKRRACAGSTKLSCPLTSLCREVSGYGCSKCLERWQTCGLNLKKHWILPSPNEPHYICQLCRAPLMT